MLSRKQQDSSKPSVVEVDTECISLVGSISSICDRNINFGLVTSEGSDRNINFLTIYCDEEEDEYAEFGIDDDFNDDDHQEKDDEAY